MEDEALKHLRRIFWIFNGHPEIIPAKGTEEYEQWIDAKAFLLATTQRELRDRQERGF